VQPAGYFNGQTFNNVLSLKIGGELQSYDQSGDVSYIGWNIMDASSNIIDNGVINLPFAGVSGNNDIWRESNSSNMVEVVNTGKLSASGSYTLSLWFYVTDNDVPTTVYDSRGGANYVATINTDASLPVTLSSFSAKAVKGTVALEWETSAEIENQGFVISRQSTVDSRDGFETRPEMIVSFATDDALKGQGSTTETTQYRYVDTDVELGKTYVYTLADVDYEGKETLLEKVEVQVGAEGAIVADGYALDPLYPNPFNATLTIPFTLTESMNVSIDLYSITGQKMMTVVNREFGAGSYNYTVQTHDLASGMYVVRTSFNGRNHMQKAVLLK
jgi:hypothetical protein